MLFGKIPLANDAATKAHWERDALPELHYNDALWGFAIRSSKVLQQEQQHINDPVLYCLLRMGIFDWTGVNNLQAQAMQAVQWASATSVRILERIFKIKRKVRLFASIAFRSRLKCHSV